MLPTGTADMGLPQGSLNETAIREWVFRAKLDWGLLVHKKVFNFPESIMQLEPSEGSVEFVEISMVVESVY